MSRFKIFGIGFHKTGTTSLANALYTLGFNVTGFFGVHERNISEIVFELAYDLVERYDAFQDTPWPVLYKELDLRYPGSKFILTTRPADRWITSVVNHFKHEHIPAHEWIYGVKTAQGNEDIYVRRYEAHNLEVQEYFKDRPNDFLVMKITEGDGWEKLCPFLDVGIPSFRFPSQNMSKHRSHNLFFRGTRYLRSHLGFGADIKRMSQMATGVSSAFLRDMMHYHYSMFENSLDLVRNLSESQFEHRHAVSGASVRDLIWQQVYEEKTWLSYLTSDGQQALSFEDRSDCFTKDTIAELWKSHQLLMRRYVANLTEDDCQCRVPGGKEYIWEVLMHLANFGAQKRLEISWILKDLGVSVEPESFIRFFRPDAVAIKRP